MELKKGIKLAGVFSIATGAMISSGIFILPGLAFSIAGSGIFISYLLAGILALLGIFSIIELSTAMPRAGGDYYYINRTFGPLLGTISGFLGWFALALKSAFAIFGISEILLISFGFPPLVSSAILCLIFLGVNLIGVKEAAVFQIIMIAALLGLLTVFIVVGLPKINPTHFSSLRSTKFNNIIITSGFIFISFGGLLKVANISEEVVNPKKNIPLGMISSIVVVTLFYTLIVVVLTGILDSEAFSGSLTPVADSAKLLMGTPGYVAIIIASMLAFITTANAGLMAASRYPLALSRDNLIPPFFGYVSKKRKIPVLSLFITVTLIYLALLLPLDMLIKAASTVILVSYVLTNLAVIVLRESKLTNYQPSFKAPLYPWLQIGSIILFSFYIIELGAQAIEVSLGFVSACFFIYLFYGRRKAKNEYALLHLLKRITDKRLIEDLLEDELRDILINRDEIEQDNFDQMIRDASVIDVEGSLDYEQLLFMVAKKIANKTEMDVKTIIERFKKRQQECNTAISSFLAIPHILIDGKSCNFMLVIRCKDGVRFSENEPDVKAIFFLCGTKDRRVLHLKTIASLATLVGQSGFQEKWLNKENPIELKNLMMLSKRKRFL
jgi:basic amino acid/polyamine antiporter, APA family